MLISNLIQKQLGVVTEIIMVHTLKNINVTCSFTVFVLMIDLAVQLFFTKEKMQSIHLLKQFLKSTIIVKALKKHFNKNLVMSAEDEKRFQSTNKYCLCSKLFDIGDNMSKIIVI